VEQKYKKSSENPDNKTFKDKEYLTSPYTFERYYLSQLELDAKKEARPINKADYKPKTFRRAVGTEAPEYLDERGREDEFMEDHSLFLENKKEQQDRIQLFYILEQFYEQTREKPSEMSEAQDHMRDYFSNPENTFFFDKNKIQ